MDSYDAPKQFTLFKWIQQIFHVDNKQAEQIGTKTCITYEGNGYNMDLKLKTAYATANEVENKIMDNKSLVIHFNCFISLNYLMSYSTWPKQKQNRRTHNIESIILDGQQDMHLCECISNRPLDDYGSCME